MIRPTVIHATTVVARHFANVATGVVFAAWEDPARRAQWDVPGNDWVLAARDGLSRRRSRLDALRTQGRSVLLERGRIPRHRAQRAGIVTAGTMHSDSARVSSTLCTIEFAREANGTRLVLFIQKRGSRY